MLICSDTAGQYIPKELKWSDSARGIFPGVYVDIPSDDGTGADDYSPDFGATVSALEAKAVVCKQVSHGAAFRAAKAASVLRAAKAASVLKKRSRGAGVLPNVGAKRQNIGGAHRLGGVPSQAGVFTRAELRQARLARFGAVVC